MPLAVRFFLIVAMIFAIGQVSYGDESLIRDQLKIAQKEGDTYAQIELLRRLLDVQPDDAAAHARLIDLWLQISDYDRAEAALTEWKAAPPGVVALVTAQVLYKRDEKLDEAIQTLQTYLQSSPKDTPALNELSDYLALKKDWNAQLPVLDALIVQKPNPDWLAKHNDTHSRADWLLARASAKRILCDYSGAITDAKAAQSLVPDYSAVTNAHPAYERLAVALPVIDSYTAKLAADPNDLKSLLARGSLYQYVNISSLALPDAEAALKIFPGSVSSRILKARSLYSLNKITSNDAFENYQVYVSLPTEKDTTTAGIIDCDVFIAKNPTDAQAFANRASWLNEDTGQYPLALEDAKAALKLDPKLGFAMLQALYASAMSGNLEAARSYLHSLTDLKPTPKKEITQALQTLALIFFKKSNYTVALEFSDQALKQKETEEMLRCKADCLVRLGKQKEAEAVTKRIMELRKKKK